MEELEQVLGIRSCPMNWPSGVDGDFQGVYQRESGNIRLYSGGNHGMSMADQRAVKLDSPETASALEVAFTNPLIDSFCIVSGDSDYTPLVSCV